MTDLATQRQRRVLILGANGRFGLAAAQAFDAAGWEVMAQVRRAPAAGMPVRARIIALPTSDIDAVVANAAGADVVVHALNPSDYTRWAAELLPMARQGMDIAERLGARFALPGNVYNYGAAMPATLNASTPQWPSTNKGRLRVQLEDELRLRAPRLRSFILRAGDFFGAGSGVWFDLVIAKNVASGRLGYLGTRTLPHAWAYLPDMARAMVGLCELDTLPDFVDIPFEGSSLTGDQLLDAIEDVARGAGIGGARPFKRSGAPWPLFRVMALVLPLWREILDMRYLWETPHRLDGRALANWLPSFRATPLPLALRASLDELGHIPAAPIDAPRLAAAAAVR
ncbi:MAG: NAD-dependent epimerase/dehydratase family protein [Burkholderiaceae bacterium]